MNKKDADGKLYFSAPIPVLDHGSVRLVDIMGDDDAIVQAARTSYGKGTKTVSEDAKLVDYLVRNRHTSPLEMVEFKFHCVMPMFVARQWVRHRTASINEYSARYSEVKDVFYVPHSSRVLGQGKANKQGSEGDLPLGAKVTFIEDVTRISKEAYEAYKLALESGVARETARILLPVNFYTEWYWKIDLHNLLHFLKLRLDKHAQYEIRVYAEAIARIVQAHCPVAWESFSRHFLTENHHVEK